MSQMPERETTWIPRGRAAALVATALFVVACAGSDDEDGPGGIGDSDAGEMQGSGGGGTVVASGGGTAPDAGGAAGLLSGGQGNVWGSGGASLGAGGQGSNGMSGGALGSGGVDSTVASGGGTSAMPGEPALGSHDGDGTGCAEGQVADSCGICDGDGSSCGCPEGDICWDIVFEHNEVRRQLNLGEFSGQPVPNPPIAMVSWDPLIAQKAQEYADGMENWSEGHSSQQFRTYQSSHINGYHGENLAVGGGDYAEPRSFVYEGWCYSEAQGCTLSGCGGHYTQVAWRESLWIGCGQKEDLPFEVEGKTYTGTLTVCQYGPGGNISGRDPY